MADWARTPYVEFECPHCGMDFDLDDPVPAKGSQHRCAHCENIVTLDDSNAQHLTHDDEGFAVILPW